MMEWELLTTAPDQTTAESWVELFAEAGVEIRLAPADSISFLGVSARPCRLLVLAAQGARARALLGELGLPGAGDHAFG